MDWIGGDSTVTSSVLIERANKWYKTLHKQKVWNKLSDEQTKILNLTTQLANSKNELKELKTQLQAHVTLKGKGNKGGTSEGSNSNSNSNSNSTADYNKNSNWEEEKTWHCKKKGSYNWYQKLKAGLKAREFVPSQIDPCIFMKAGIIIVTYVDDCIIVSDTRMKIDHLVHSLEHGTEQFILTKEGTLDKFLGVDIRKVGVDGFELSQPFFERPPRQFCRRWMRT